MVVWINDEARTLPEQHTVSALLERLDLADAAVAVAVNGRFVPRSAHAKHVLQADDRIELVAPMAGG